VPPGGLRSGVPGYPLASPLTSTGPDLFAGAIRLEDPPLYLVSCVGIEGPRRHIVPGHPNIGEPRLLGHPLRSEIAREGHEADHVEAEHIKPPDRPTPGLGSSHRGCGPTVQPNIRRLPIGAGCRVGGDSSSWISFLAGTPCNAPEPNSPPFVTTWSPSLRTEAHDIAISGGS
jgi:hypothetical protein